MTADVVDAPLMATKELLAPPVHEILAPLDRVMFARLLELVQERGFAYDMGTLNAPTSAPPLVWNVKLPPVAGRNPGVICA